MTQQHTSGPWTLNEAMNFSGTWDAWLGKDHVTIAHIQSHVSKELATANARLIAAAPAYRAALEDLVLCGYNLDKIKHATLETLVDIRIALTKSTAEGSPR